VSWNQPQPPADGHGTGGVPRPPMPGPPVPGPSIPGPSIPGSPASSGSWGAPTMPASTAPDPGATAIRRTNPQGSGRPGRSGSIIPAGPPMLWLQVASALVIAGLVVFAVARGATLGLVGWILAGPLAIGALAGYTVADGRRRLDGWYAPSLLAEWQRRMTIVAALVVVALNAWRIADDVARGVWT